MLGKQMKGQFIRLEWNATERAVHLSRILGVLPVDRKVFQDSRNG